MSIKVHSTCHPMKTLSVPTTSYPGIISMWTAIHPLMALLPPMLLLALLQSLQSPPFDSDPFPCSLHKVPQLWCSDLQQSEESGGQGLEIPRTELSRQARWSLVGYSQKCCRRCNMQVSAHTYTHRRTHAHTNGTHAQSHNISRYTYRYTNIFTYTYIPIRTHTLYPEHRHMPTWTHINMSLIPVKSLCFSLDRFVPMVTTLRDLARPKFPCNDWDRLLIDKGFETAYWHLPCRVRYNLEGVCAPLLFFAPELHNPHVWCENRDMVLKESWCRYWDQKSARWGL